MKNTNQSTINGLILGVIAIGVEALIISPILEDISKTFQVTPGVAGWTVSSYGLALAIFSPLFASVSERFQRQKIMFLGLLIFAAANILCMLSNSFEMLMISRILSGASAGAYLPNCYSYVADTTAYEERGNTMGRVMAGWSISLIFGIPLGAITADIFGWRMCFLIVAGISILAALKISKLQNSPKYFDVQLLPSKKIKLIFRRKNILLLAINFTDMLSFYGIYTYLGRETRTQLESGSASFGAFVLCYGVGLFLSTTNGWIIDRLGKIATIKISLLSLFFLLSFILPSSINIWIALTFTMLSWGVFQGFAQTSIATAISETTPNARGVIMATLSCSTYLAVTISSIFGGLVYDSFGFEYLSIAGGVCALTAFAALYYLE